MKKTFIVAALTAALAFCADASAQSYLSPRVGIIGGFTSSSTSIKEVDNKSVSLYHVGLTAEIPLFGGLAIQPSVLYQVKGLSADKWGSSSVSETVGSFETKVGYLEVPVQIQWGPDLLAFRPYVFAEPFIGYRLGQNTEGVFADGLKDSLKKFEYGLGVGGGVEVWKLQLSIKYFWNFGDIYDKGGNLIDSSKDAVRDAVNNGNNFNGIMASVAFFF